MPIFHDINTPRPFIDPTIPREYEDYPEDKNAIEQGAALPDHIYMDAMAFGMGCCCLQITFQAVNVEEARKIYDQMAPLGPIMLATPCERQPPLPQASAAGQASRRVGRPQLPRGSWWCW